MNSKEAGFIEHLVKPVDLQAAPGHRFLGYD
jgi:hypothetical protein